jgi:hypothetical protein
MRFIILIFLTFLFFYCSRTEKNFLPDTIQENRKITFHEIDISLEDINYPWGSMIKVSDYLLLLDKKGGVELKAIDLVNRKVIPLISRGRGPGEFLFAKSLSGFNDFSSFFYIIDSRTIHIMNADLIGSDESIITQSIHLSDVANINQMYYINDSLWLATGPMKEESMAAVLGRDFTKVNNTVVPYPHSKLNLNANNILLGMIYQFVGTVRPNKTSILFSLPFSDLIEIYDIKDETLNKVFSDFTFLPEFEITGEFQYRHVFFRKGFDHFIESNDNLIFLPYFSARYRDGIENLNSRADKILVMDWNGNPILNLELEVFIQQITLDQATNRLYAIVPGEKWRIGYFDLNEILK